MRHGDLRRLGVIGPAGNMALEWELPKYLPQGMALNHARAVRPGATTLTKTSLIEMGHNAIDVATSLVRTRPEMILYACTSGSFVDGLDGIDDISDQITLATGIPALTASRAVLDAVQALDARTVFLLTPYPDEINRSEIRFLEAAGLTVTDCVAHRCSPEYPIGAVSSQETEALLLTHEATACASDLIFISCTNLLSFEIIPRLEAKLGRPVISSNLSLLWSALHRLNIAPAPKAGHSLISTLPRAVPDQVLAPTNEPASTALYERTTV